MDDSRAGLAVSELIKDILAGLTAVQLEGQLLPGLSLVRPSEGSHAGLPILTFPGNLGSADTLRDAWQRMEAG